MTTLLAIAGSGRTGSTLLSVLLSQAPQTFNVGQLRDFWASFAKNEPCTCGAPLRDCPVWGKVVRTAFGERPKQALQQMHNGMAAFAKAAGAIKDWAQAPAVAALRGEHGDYLEGLATFLAAVSTVTGAQVLVDASKSPELALGYSLVPELELRVLNLVRDPRAVAASWDKKRGEEMALNQSKTWLLRQTILMRWSHALGSRFALLRYEDFTARPQSTIAQLLRWIGVEAGAGFFTSESHAEVSWANQHIYPPGNEKLIAEKREAVDIVEASAWRQSGKPALLRKVEKIVRPALAQLNYPETVAIEEAAVVAPTPAAKEKKPVTASRTPAPPRQPAAADQQHVFLICSERSGSNLIGAMLNSHPDIGSTPPYHLCRDVGLNWHGLLGAEAGTAAWDKVMQLVAARLGKFRTAESAAEFRRWFAARGTPAFGELARQVFGPCSGLDDKRVVFIKENNLHRMLFFVLQDFPDAKFVFQVRDPRDYLLSAMNRKDGPMGNKFGSSLRALEIWREDQLGGLAALAHLGRERVFFQRYEDLLRDPQAVLTALCAFLGLPFDAAMLDFHESDYAQDLAVQGGPRENLAKPLMSDNTAKYRQGLGVEQIRMVEIYLGDLMARFGYRRDYPDTAQASRHELFWPLFLEPVERFANGETSPFYSDGAAATGFGERGAPLQPDYGTL